MWNVHCVRTASVLGLWNITMRNTCGSNCKAIRTKCNTLLYQIGGLGYNEEIIMDFTYHIALSNIRSRIWNPGCILGTFIGFEPRYDVPADVAQILKYFIFHKIKYLKIQLIYPRAISFRNVSINLVVHILGTKHVSELRYFTVLFA